MSKATYSSTNRDESNVNKSKEEHECSYYCDCSLPWDFDKYGPSRDDSEEDDGHDTVILENEFGRYQKCLNCGVEAVGLMITQFSCGDDSE